MRKMDESDRRKVDGGIVHLLPVIGDRRNPLPVLYHGRCL